MKNYVVDISIKHKWLDSFFIDAENHFEAQIICLDLLYKNEVFKKLNKKPTLNSVEL